jgi:hypothetical protein
MPNLAILKKVAAIFLSICFLVNSVMIPFCNFQDTGSVKILYNQFLENDSDGNVLEFITNNILHIGGLLGDEDDDEDAPLQQIPSSQQQQHPIQPIQITPGFLYCAQSITWEEKAEPSPPRVFCFFISTNYNLDFSTSVFHPPAIISC